MTLLPFVLLLVGAMLAYAVNHRAAASLRSGGARLHSSPQYHGLFAALTVLTSALLLALVWLALDDVIIDHLIRRSLPPPDGDAASAGAMDLVMAEIHSLARGQTFGTPEPWKQKAADRLTAFRTGSAVALLVSLTCLSIGVLTLRRRRFTPELRARQGSERLTHAVMFACCAVALLTTAGIVAALLFETAKFLQKVPLSEFLFGLNWEPQIPIREDQVAASGAFGWTPVLVGTLVVTVVALVVAVPTGLFAAIYLNEFAHRRFKRVAKPVLEVLAGVPTVVYGFFAILVISPAMRRLGDALGLDVAPNSALAAGLVMGVMLIPFITSFADDALSAVPQALRDGALALGSTRAETMLKVLFPAALPGIVGGVLLAVSRAIGETMIVVMAAGLIARLTLNPLDSVTTVTVQIVTLLIGDTAFDNPKTLAAFALGTMLFLVTLMINILAIRVVQKYRETYD
ncbi:phosphate ABC transporter permease subunit PstC [Thalassorhabdomicrobium marinisediminis]|uniref:Phosphate transport system permease protein n=1 Tax=Thalassorhabdomicrobium marinisediminis TaxID=2170577 RepID=A0A2T7FT89_9RHOB|nr:phosphate ABC transporter permease subunit PstC [Thalassorhabdomicrobium marinisediminis]PVA05376.1 phosphate ABC transporter permease subunit PstC [Thalassorhabdomicrobium marinisediminis]